MSGHPFSVHTHLIIRAAIGGSRFPPFGARVCLAHNCKRSIRMPQGTVPLERPKRCHLILAEMRSFEARATPQNHPTTLQQLRSQLE